VITIVPGTHDQEDGSDRMLGRPSRVLAGPVRVRGAVAQPGAAELHGRVRDPPP